MESKTIRDCNSFDRSLVFWNTNSVDTQASAELVRDGKKQLKHLDALAKNVYKSSPEKLRAWQSARHMEHAPVHPATTPTPAPTATATAK